MNLFSHEALSLEGTRELVYTAMSKHYFYFRMHISRFVLDQGKVPLNPLLRYFLLFLICIMGAECGAEETWKGELIHTEYVHPIDDDSTIPLPFVKLKGKIIQHTFPGVPNYESIEDGDAPETRWVLVIPETEIQGLRQSRYIPQEDIFGSKQRGWVQLISPGTEEEPSIFINEQVVVEGYLGTLIFHIHTPITIEATNIYDEAQKID